MPTETQNSSSSGPVTRASAKQSFLDAAKTAGIKNPTITKLDDEDFDSIAAIQSMEDDDIAELDITKGQKRLLKSWRQSLLQPRSGDTNKDSSGPTQPSTEDGVIPDVGVNTQSLARDQELRSLLESMKDKLPGNQLWGNTSPALLQEVRNTWDDSKSQGKPLLIVDFISNMSYGTVSMEEHEVVKQGTSQLVLRSSRVKPLPEQITLAQWISSNARIMSKLITDGKLSSQQQMLDYLQYTADFGDYAQTCEIPSLMVYDQEYRRKQATSDRSWGEDDIHLCTFYLHRKQRSDKRHQPHNRANRQNTWNKPPRLLDLAGVEICRNFNSVGCTRENCQYSHSCLICKDKSHPKTRHPQPSH